MLGKSISKKRGCIAAAILLAIVSTAELVANHMFLKNHLPEASLYETDAYWQFLGVRLLDAAEAIATLILVGALLGVLYEMVLSYTIVDYKTKGSELLSLRATERQHEEYKKRMCILLGIFALSTVASIADAIWRLEFAWIWIISFSICAIGIWNLYSLMQDIVEQIRFYYQPDALHKND